MRLQGRAWLVFAGCALIVGVALGWITMVALRLERAELEATAEAEHREAVRFALWRMDSWLSVFLGREAARPYSDYLVSDKPSPLAALDSEYLPLHFQLDVEGVTSPQSTVRRRAFEERAAFLDLDHIARTVAQAESLPTTNLASQSMSSAGPLLPAPPGDEFETRAFCSVPPAPGSAWADGRVVDVGALIPLWLSHPLQLERIELAFVRRVGIGDGKLFQGFFVDWTRLRERLLGESRDLLPDAELVRVSAEHSGVEAAGPYLANVPAALIAGATPLPAAPRLSPTRAILGLGWLLTIVAALAIGHTLHKSVQLGERRRRFVSAVTHELRTPLTTFKMYSEMLATGMVRDEGARKQYLETLRDESERLSTMVENVLAHPRLESNGTRTRAAELTLDDLLRRLTPPLLRQAEAADVELEVQRESPGSSRVSVDVDAIGQVLQNLVDNATKYGKNGSEPGVRLGAAIDNGTLTLSVRDRGPGIHPAQRQAIFDAFDRGGRDSSDPSPGIGLGLAISRGLARDMGGDLTLECPAGGGACFRLRVPAT